MRLLSTLFLFGVLLARGLAAESATPLGVVYAGQEAFFDLVYRNETAAPVAIQRISPGCDCITVLSHPDIVAPGATARIPCVYRSTVPGNIRTVVEMVGKEKADPVFTFHVAGFVAEKSWLVTARDAIAAGDKIMLVDVRSPDAFVRAHLPRAFNLRAFALKSQTPLRDQRMVLVDEGTSPETLLAEVLKLREQGFKQVSVLAGGLPAWLRAGGKLEGQDQAVEIVTTISAADYDRASTVSPWLCIEVGAKTAAAKPAVPVLQADSIEDLEKKLAGWSRPVSGGADFRPVLILSVDPALAGRLEQRVARAQGWQVYHLAGGNAALAAYQASQVALARHTGQTFVSQPVSSRPVVSGRCGSCGR